MGKNLHNNIVAKEYAHDIADDLIYCQNTNAFYFYNNDLSFYELLPQGQLQNKILDYCEENYETPLTIAKINDIISFLRIRALYKTETIFTPHIALKNAVINTTTFEIEHIDKINKPCFFSLPFSFEEIKNAKEPTRFLKFLNEILIDPQTNEPDTELVELMQEATGYFLQNKLTGYMVFFLIGEGYNGKSIFLQLLEHIVGKENTSALSLQQLTADQFAQTGIIGKKINICTEDESKYLKSDKFKSLVDGSKINMRRIYESNFDYYPETKFIFSSNIIPRFTEVNKGIRRRLRFIPFNANFEGRDDKMLLHKLLSELPGIIRWAIKGGQRFVQNKHIFRESAQSKQIEREFINTVSSAVEFVDTCFNFDPTKTLSKFTVYAIYKYWCQLVGRKPQSKRNFEEDLKQTNRKIFHDNNKDFYIEIDEKYAPDELKAML